MSFFHSVNFIDGTDPRAPLDYSYDEEPPLVYDIAPDFRGAVESGGYAYIFKGTRQGRKVALKELKATETPTKAAKVRTLGSCLRNTQT